MQIETLKIFCDLVDTKSFSRAAEADYVTDEQRTGQLAVVALAEPEWTRSVGVIPRSDRTRGTAARKFIQLLTDTSEPEAKER